MASKEIDKLRRDKKKAKNKDNYEEVANICNKLGELLAKEGLYDDAIDEHQTELSISEMRQDQIGTAIAHRKIGECYCELGDFEKALDHQRLHLEGARRAESLAEEQRALTTIGRTYLIRAEISQDKERSKLLSRSEDAFQKSLDLCGSLKAILSDYDYYEMKSRSLLNIGCVMAQNLDGEVQRKKCIEYIKQAISLSRKYNLMEDIYRGESLLAGIYLKNKMYREALEKWNAACDAAQKSGNKSDLFEALSAKAKLYIEIGDYSKALVFGRKAHKLNTGRTVSLEERESLRTTLSSAWRMKKASEELKQTRQNEGSKMKLYERLGDEAANIGLYENAIKFYRSMLEHAKASGKCNSDLIPAYVSLSQTYKDNRDYKNYEVYVRKELELRKGDAEQECRTWLNIAEAEELNEKGYNAVKQSYLNAINIAAKIKNRRLQARGLESLAVAQQNYDETEASEETKQKLDELKRKYDIDLDCDDVESLASSGCKDDQDEEEVDWDVILETDSSDGEEYDRENTSAARRPRRHKPVKLNEKGETPLHRACIDGNLKKVKGLIQQGHAINVRDYSGWLPIHEACNHGYVEIVSYLIENGAWIDDRGGEECDGITPLHDAASNGFLEVVRLLVEKGADVHAKDDHGKTAYDFLNDLAATCGDISRDESILLDEVKKLLRRTMTGNNPHLPHKNRDIGRSYQSDTDIDLEVLMRGSQHKRSTRDRNEFNSNRRRRRRSSSSHSEHGQIEDSISGEDENFSCTPQSSPSKGHRPSGPFHSPARSPPSVVQDEDQQDSEEIYLNPALESLEVIDPNDAANVFQKTIMEVRSSAITQNKKPWKSASHPAPKPSAPVPALLNEQETIGDDWLIEDLKPSRRKQTNIDAFFGTGGTRSRKPRDSVNERPTKARNQEKRPRSSDLDDLEHYNRVHEGYSSDVENRKRARLSSGSYVEGVNHINAASTQHINTSLMDDRGSDEIHGMNVSVTEISDEGEQFVSQDFSSQGAVQSVAIHRQSQASREGSIRRYLSSTKPAQSRPQTTLPHNVATNQPATTPAPDSSKIGAIMRVKVRINDKLFLVPISMDSSEPKTIEWLCNETADRYYQSFNLRPILSLCTQDGARLSPADLISMVLTHNEEVQAEVQNWNLPPFATRYADACKGLNQVAYKNIRILLEVSECSYKLDLSQLALRTSHFLPIWRAIQCQKTLQELHVPGNHLGDNGLQELAKVLHTLPSLRVLDISNNTITWQGITSLSDNLIAKRTEKPLQLLERLEMSHNLLGDSTTDCLSTIISELPRLLHLGLVSCDLTKNFFQQYRIKFSNALRAHALRSIDMSYNNLGSTGVELLLKSLKPSSITDLNLTGTIQGYTANHLAKHLVNYVQQEECALQNVSLVKCHLTWEHTPDLVSFVEKSPSLRCLDFSGNSKLQTGVAEILTAVSKLTESCVESFTASGCGLVAPLNVDFIDAIADKLNHSTPLRYLRLSCKGLTKMDVESLLEIWRSQWAESAECSVIGENVTLSVKHIK